MNADLERRKFSAEQIAFYADVWEGNLTHAAKITAVIGEESGVEAFKKAAALAQEAGLLLQALRDGTDRT